MKTYKKGGHEPDNPKGGDGDAQTAASGNTGQWLQRCLKSNRYGYV